MHESGALSWREVVERHHSALLEELSGRLDLELRDSVARALAQERTKVGEQMTRACDEARRSHAEASNQLLRRLRLSVSEEQTFELLNQSCAAYARQSVVLLFESNQARASAVRGLNRNSTGVAFEVAAAPALASAIESRDMVVALATSAEISHVLSDAFNTARNDEDQDGEQENDKAYLFPLVVRHSVQGVLVAVGGVEPAPIELLCEAAGIKLEALTPLTPHAGAVPSRSVARDFIQLNASAPGGPVPENHSWDELAPDDQRLHLQAQRAARVRVAGIRLDHGEALRKGMSSGDIYSSLQKEIEAARIEFLQTFLSKSPTMVDYLHLEILRTLAHDDDRLLGEHYPGPMV